MTWVAVGSASASMLITSMQGGQNSLNRAKQLKAQNAARIKQLNQQFEFDTQNMYNNKQAIDRNKFKNDVLIQENKLDAQDAFSQAFAGSGVRGRSVDALEAQIVADVGKAINENEEQAGQSKDRQFLGIMRQSQQNTQAIDNMEAFDFGAEKAANDMATWSAGVNSLASQRNLEKWFNK